MTETKIRPMTLVDYIDPGSGVPVKACSPDNGQTYKIYFTPWGIVWHADDVEVLWNDFLLDKVKSVMSVSWDQIQGKPVLVTKGELDQRLSSLDIPSVDGLAKQSDLDNVKATADSAKSKAEQAQSTADANTKALQNVYTKEEADRKYWTAEQEQNASNVKSVNNVRPDDQGNVNIDLTGYVKQDELPKSMSWSQITDKPSLALSSDIPSLDGYAKLTDIPSVTGLVKETELSDYVRKSDLPTMPDLSGYATISSLIDYVKKTDLPDFTLFAKKSDIPAEQDLSNYVKKPDLNNYVTNETYSHNETSLENTIENLQTSLNNKNQVVTVTSGTLADLATKNGTYHYEIDCSPTDAPVADWGLCDVVVGEHYAKQTFTNTGNKSGDSYLRIRDYDGNWSDWREVTLWQ